MDRRVHPHPGEKERYVRKGSVEPFWWPGSREIGRKKRPVLKNDACMGKYLSSKIIFRVVSFRSTFWSS